MSDLKARLKAAALAASKPIPVQTEAFGLVHIKRMTVASSKDMQSKDASLDEVKALVMSICDEHGNPVLDINDANDVAIARDLSKHEVAQLLLVIYTGNGLGESGKEAAQKN